MLRQGLADSGKAVAAAERTRRDRGPEGEHRNVLARMVGAVPGRIAAVIGGDDREIARAQRLAERRQPGIEALERPSIASRVAAMAVERVEIVEIGEDQRAWSGVARSGEHRREPAPVLPPLDQPADSPTPTD